MVGIFRANNPFNTFLLFIYGLLLKFEFLISAPMPGIKKTDTVFFRELILRLNIASAGLPFIYPVIVYLLLVTQAITFNRLLNDQRLIQQPTHLPAMSYLLITSLFAEWNTLTPALLVNTLLIWILGKLNNLYNNSNPKTALFNVGMAVGISAFIYFPSLAFAILIIFALLMNRPFSLAEWVIALVGIITPFYFLLVWLFLNDRLHQYRIPAFTIGYPNFSQNYWPLVAIVLVIAAFITGAYFVQANLSRQVVQVRKSWSLIVVYLFVSVLVTFFNHTHSFEYWILTVIPLSAFATSAFFYPTSKWFTFLLHVLMVGFVIATSYFLR